MGAGGGPRAAGPAYQPGPAGGMTQRQWELLARQPGNAQMWVAVGALPPQAMNPGMIATAQRVTGIGGRPANRTSNFAPAIFPATAAAVGAAARGFLGPATGATGGAAGTAGTAGGLTPGLGDAGGGMGGMGGMGGGVWGGRNGGVIRRRRY